jgi:hypothetical protein
MTQAYQTSLPGAGQDSAAVLVMHCSDPRYQPHFQTFLREALKLDRYALVAVPGGAQCLTLTEYLPKFSWAGWRWVKFMVNLTAPSRVVLIGHDDCRWYIENRFVHDHTLARDKQVADLKHARAALNERFGNVPIDLFFATLSGNTATFDRI